MARAFSDGLQHAAFDQLSDLIGALPGIEARHGPFQIAGLHQARTDGGLQHGLFLRGDELALPRMGHCGEQHGVLQVGVIGQAADLFQFVANAAEHIGAPILQLGRFTGIGGRQHGVVAVAVGAEHGGRVQQTARRADLEAVLDQHGVGQQANHPPVAVAEGVHPGKAVVRQRHLHQVVFGGVRLVDERHQLRHVARHLNRVGRQVLGLGDAHRPRAVAARGTVALALQTVHRGGVQTPQQVLTQGRAGLHGRFDLAHGGLDVVDLAQGLGAGGGRGHPGLHVVGQRGVVAFDAGRRQALQQVENLFELHKDRGWRAAPDFKPAQMLQVGEHVQQRRVEPRVQQLQIVVQKLRHADWIS